MWSPNPLHSILGDVVDNVRGKTYGEPFWIVPGHRKVTISGVSTNVCNLTCGLRYVRTSTLSTTGERLIPYIKNPDRVAESGMWTVRLSVSDKQILLAIIKVYINEQHLSNHNMVRMHTHVQRIFVYVLRVCTSCVPHACTTYLRVCAYMAWNELRVIHSQHA